MFIPAVALTQSRASALLTKILGFLWPVVCNSAGLEGRKEGWILLRFPVLLWVTDTKHFSCSSLPTIRRAGMQPQKSNRNHPLRHDNDSRCSKQTWSAPLQGALPHCASKELKERLAISLSFVRREWRQEKKILRYHFGAVERRLILEKECKISNSDLPGKDCKPVSHLLPFHSLLASLHTIWSWTWGFEILVSKCLVNKL